MIFEPTFRSYIRVRIKVLEKKHFVWSLVTEVVPSLSRIAKHVCCLSGVALGDVIASDKVCVVNSASIAERKGTVFDWVAKWTPDNVEISVTHSKVLGVSNLLYYPDSTCQEGIGFGGELVADSLCY